jgi:hypothetical protein
MEGVLRVSQQLQQPSATRSRSCCIRVAGLTAALSWPRGQRKDFIIIFLMKQARTRHPGMTGIFRADPVSVSQSQLGRRQKIDTRLSSSPSQRVNRTRLLDAPFQPLPRLSTFPNTPPSNPNPKCRAARGTHGTTVSTSRSIRCAQLPKG